MRKAIKKILILTLLGLVCLALFWLYSPASVCLWILSSSPIANLTIESIEAISSDELLFKNVSYKEKGLGQIELGQVKVSLLPWRLASGESPVDEVIISKGGSYKALPGKAEKKEKAPLLLPFRSLKLHSPGILLSSSPKLSITSAEITPSSQGKLSLKGNLHTLGSGSGQLTGDLSLTKQKGTFSFIAKELPCAALASLVTTVPVRGFLSLQSQLDVALVDEKWSLEPKGKAEIKELFIGDWIKNASCRLVGSTEKFQVTSMVAEIETPYSKKLQTRGNIELEKAKASLNVVGKSFEFAATFSKETSSPIDLLQQIAQNKTDFSVIAKLNCFPMTTIKEMKQPLKIKNGKVSGELFCDRKAKEDYRLSGSLLLKSLSLRSKIVGLDSMDAALKTSNEQLSIDVSRGSLLLRGLPRMTIVAKALVEKSQIQLTKLLLQGKRGFKVNASASFDGLPPYETNSIKKGKISIINLPIGPRRLLAPSLLGTPLAGLMSFNLELQRPAGNAIEYSNFKCNLDYECYPRSLIPLEAALSAEQDKDSCRYSLSLAERAKDSAVLLTGNRSTASMTVTSFPLYLFKAPVDKLSLNAKTTWSAPKGSYPFARLFTEPPQKFNVSLQRAKLFGRGGQKVLELLRASTFDLWTKKRVAKGNLAFSLMGQNFSVQLHQDEKQPLTLNTESLSLSKLWKELYPQDYFFKPLGSLAINISGPQDLRGLAKLTDGGLEYWQKSEGVIRCLNVYLPPLGFRLQGTRQNPSLHSEMFSCSLVNEELSFALKEFPITWQERAPLEQKTLRKGSLSLDGHLKSGKGHLNLDGFSESIKKDGTYAHLSLKGDLEKKAKHEESIVIDVNDKTGGKGLLTAQSKNSQLSAKLKTTKLSLGHLPGNAALDDVILDLDCVVNMSLPLGLFRQLNLLRKTGIKELAKLLRRDGKLTIKQMALNGNDLEVSVNHPFSAKFSGTGVKLDAFEATLAKQRIKASGSFDPYGSCSLSLETDKVPLAGLLTLAGLTSLDADGFLTAQLGLEGKMPFPDLEGSLSLQGGRLRFPYIAENLTLASLHLSSKGPTTIVSAIDFKWGESPLEFVGRQQDGTTEVDLSGKGLICTVGQTRIPAIDLQAKLIVPQSGLPKVTVAAKGNQGTTIHLPSSIPQTKSTSSEQLDRAVSLLSSVDANLQIELPSRLRLVNKFIDAEVRGSASLKSKPSTRILIKLQLVSGEVILHRRTFKLLQGTLTIAGNPRSPRTTLNLKAKTVVGDYSVELAAAGSLDKPQVSLSSIPALSEESIIALLTMGMVPMASTADVRSEVTATARDYLVTSALSDYLLASLNLRDLTLRSTTEGSFVRMRRYLGRRLRVDVEQAIKQHESGKKRALSFELGLDDKLYLEGRKTTGEVNKRNDSYLGFFRTFRFR